MGLEPGSVLIWIKGLHSRASQSYRKHLRFSQESQHMLSQRTIDIVKATAPILEEHGETLTAHFLQENVCV